MKYLFRTFKSTLTQCGGSGMYIKNGIEYTILDKLTQCHKDICESIFVELKHPKKKCDNWINL